ncbi:MAG: ATP-binding protein [Deltaproteobacteria bacterium]|nr:ATP-binding protein [Deltaproteobacteria bacterium]
MGRLIQESEKFRSQINRNIAGPLGTNLGTYLESFLDTPPLANMSKRHQLGLLPFAEPAWKNAIHTRLDHTIGVMAKCLVVSDMINELLKTLDDMYNQVKPNRNPSREKRTLDLMYEAVINKIKNACLSQTNLIDSQMPPWAYSKQTTISIISGDKTDRLTKRFISAVLQHLLVKRHDYPKLIVIDECHQLFEEDQRDVSSGQLIEQMLRESRKFGIGLILITQVEEDIPKSVRQQIQNTFTFRTLNKIDLHNLQDRLCQVKLKLGQAEFIMRVADIG